MGLLTANDILTDVGYVLIDKPVDTTFTVAVTAGPQTATPGSMAGIYNGALLITGDNQEIIVAANVTATTFDATYLYAHAAGARLYGVTFPTGQPNDPFFTQNEMLGYVGQAQNEYLLFVRCVFAVASETILATTKFYNDPTDSIRIERISATIADGVINELWNTSQRSLDLEDPNWPATSASFPTTWYQDALNTSRHGYTPKPNVGTPAELWYSKRGPSIPLLTDTLLLPDVFAHFIKYGVLMRCFTKDGEMRDPTRADYCQRRFKLGVMVGVKFMYAMEAMLQEADTLPKFSPMPIPGAQGNG